MDKITTGISYGASGGGAAFWFTRLLDGYSPEQWAAIGVLGGLFFAFLTADEPLFQDSRGSPPRKNGEGCR